VTLGIASSPGYTRRAAKMVGAVSSRSIMQRAVTVVAAVSPMWEKLFAAEVIASSIMSKRLIAVMKNEERHANSITT